MSIALCLWAGPSHALQPVSDFLAHARTWSPENRAARATVERREAEVRISTGNLLPYLAANGTYTRNQYEVTTGALIPAGSLPAGVSFPSSIIQPQNQVDANVTVNVPLVNIASWDTRAAAKATLQGARADERDTQISVEKNVVRLYYTLVGDEAVVRSATKNRDVAQQNVTLAKDRQASGTGSQLDVQRALAELSKAERSLTVAQLSVVNTRRDLSSATGLAAEPGDLAPEDDLHAEAPLERWLVGTSRLPAVESARSRRLAAEEHKSAVHAGFFPTVAAVGQEKFTNATAFIGGHAEVYALQLTASWRLDTTIAAQLRAQRAAVDEAQAHEDQARRDAEDAVFHDWQQIESDIAAARSARAQVAATALAAELADDRFGSGVATQLDVLQARQDAFSADVARIQADADLAYARAALRLDAGQLSRETR